MTVVCMEEARNNLFDSFIRARETKKRAEKLAPTALNHGSKTLWYSVSMPISGCKV